MSSKPRSVPGFHSAPGRMVRVLTSMGDLILGVNTPTVPRSSTGPLSGRVISERFLPGAEPGVRRAVGGEALAGAVGEQPEGPALLEVARVDREVAGVGAGGRSCPPQQVRPDAAQVRDEF